LHEKSGQSDGSRTRTLDDVDPPGEGCWFPLAGFGVDVHATDTNRIIATDNGFAHFIMSSSRAATSAISKE
jgi:hypothetical protein